MKYADAEKILNHSLSSIYDENEAAVIADYVMQDIFLEKINNEKILTEENIFLFEKIKNRLLTAEPWQYVVGEADFYGQKFLVNPSVLIPRPETEELVLAILKMVKKIAHNPIKILDIGTGSGCIPITLCLKNKQIEGYGIDISNEALLTAEENNEKHKTNVKFIAGDILNYQNIDNEYFTHQNFDIIVSNPPYITQRERALMSKNVLDFEPSLALFVNDDEPLIFYEKIATLALQKLNPNGSIWFECNEFYATETAAMLTAKGFAEVQLYTDMQGKSRIASAIKI